ncbi:hypothetical protein [Halorubrum halodurans]|uniref:hypothetical protein n=1 Tax=Halorubrum halodurans TaxID=1383851 RepID=UPI001179A130|nr:hypothetical protein [Halorubrum halodurans]
MAADDYYDSVGQVLAYVLSSSDKIKGQGARRGGLNFYVQRDGVLLELFCPPDRRYFSLSYDLRISDFLKTKYEEETQILRGHIERYDIKENRLGDENLNDIVSYHRIKDIDEEEVDEAYQSVQSYSIHSDCRIRNLKMRDPRENKTGETWDGIKITGLLYPYEDEFSPRGYERTAQEVISVAKQVEDSVKRLDILEQTGY